MKTHKKVYSITENEAEEIKQILGSGYAGQIQNHLQQLNINNSKGLPYSSNTIRQWFNRLKFNDLHYKKIISLCRKKTREQKKLQQQLKKIA